jgi:MFS family permease
VLGALTLAQLYVVAFLAGSLTAFFDVAYQSFLPAIVERDLLGQGNATLEISRSGAQVAGPSLAGLLVAAVTAPYAILADAASFIGSASFLMRIRRVAERRVAPRTSMRTELREGLRFVLRHPILRPNLTYTATANVFNSIVFAVLLLFAVRDLHVSTAKIGLLFSGASIGSLVAASLAPRLQRRVGVGRTMLVAAFSGWWLIMIPFASGSLKIPMLVLPLVLWSFGAIVYNVSSLSLSQAVTPDRLMARMNASRRLVAWGTLPPATLLGGLLGTYLGLRTTLFIGGAGRAFAGLIILLSPVRDIRVLGDADALVESFNVEYMGDEQPG